MKILIRAAFTAISLLTIPVANAAAVNDAAPTAQTDTTSAWTNG
jgi:hypothetical protein